MERLKSPIVVAVGVAMLVILVGGLLAALPFLLANRLTIGQEWKLLSATALDVETKDSVRIGAEAEILPPDSALQVSPMPVDGFAIARHRLPSYLVLASPIYAIEPKGKTLVQRSFSLPIPAEVSSSKALDLYAWDGERWGFLPSHAQSGSIIAKVQILPQAIALMETRSAVPIAGAALELHQTLDEIRSAVNLIMSGGLILQADGSLIGTLAGGFAFDQGYAVMPLVRTGPGVKGAAALNSMLSDPQSRQTQIRGLNDLVNSGGYHGVVLDYRGLDPARGPSYSAFIKDLADTFRAQDKRLLVVVPAPARDKNGSNTFGYDLRALGAAADAVEIDFGDALLTTDSETVRDTLTWVVGQISRYRIRLLVSTLSLEVTESSYRRVSASETLGYLGHVTLQTDPDSIAPGSNIRLGLDGAASSLVYDEIAHTPRFEYTDDSGGIHTVYYATPSMLSQQLAIAQELQLGGISVRDLFNSDNTPGMLDALVRYKVKSLAVALTPEVNITWKVSNSGGVVAKGKNAPDQPFTWTAPMGGEYAISAYFDPNSSVLLGSVNIAVPKPTATPANSSEAIVVLTAIPCAGTNCPTATQEPTAAAATDIQPGPWEAFELGGHVTHGGIAPASEMKRAGMTWVKLQVLPGWNMAEAIANGHRLGFKVLLSVVGDRSQPHLPSYQQSFASYLSTLAAQGSDAIEVWNEPNLSREWPPGQISPTSYAAMLQRAYSAIKSANPNTLVISAAPSPTGFFGGCFSHGCDDAAWMAGMASAGAADYLDCLGTHYNEGVVPPSAFGAGVDPRDDHYTRYFFGMIEKYSAAFDGQRQLCFTELGYLSGEEWGYVPTHYLWKPPINNTVAEQAAYMGKAVQLARNDGRIRMIMVFNIDYTNYGDDPQAGYAIIRPNGSCPACDTLAAATR